MWSVETIKQINAEAAKGKDAYEAYEACGIRINSNTKRNTPNGQERDTPIPIGNVRDNRNVLAS